MIKYCSKCLNIDGSGTANYCGYDGESLGALKRCLCGQEILPFENNKIKFCPNCGEEIGDIYVQ